MTPLVLHRIMAVTPEGLPVLAGVNARVVAVQVFDAGAVGGQAVCQLTTDPEGLIVALGLLGEARSADAPLELRCGKAALVLAPDGSVRLTGSDVELQSTGRLRVDGALIELN